MKWINSICEIPNERWHSSGAISDISDCSDAVDVELWKIDRFPHRRVKKSSEVLRQFHHQWNQWSQFHWYYQNFSINFSERLIINEHWPCSFLTWSQFGFGGAVNIDWFGVKKFLRTLASISPIWQFISEIEN